MRKDTMGGLIPALMMGAALLPTLDRIGPPTQQPYEYALPAVKVPGPRRLKHKDDPRHKGRRR